MAELVLADAHRAEVPHGERRRPALPIEVPPDSGVRISYVEPEPMAAPLSESLSFHVYTFDELERRTSLRPSASKLVLDAPHVPWLAAWHAVRAFFHEAFRWAVSGRRSGVDARTALAAPYAVMSEHVRAFLRAADWRRIGVGLGVGIATVAALVFVVVTVAELTDDLKPASKRSVHLTTATLAAPMSAAPAKSFEGAPSAPRSPTTGGSTSTSAPIAPTERAPLLPASTLAGDVRADSFAIAPASRAVPARTTKSGGRRDTAEVFTP